MAVDLDSVLIASEVADGQGAVAPTYRTIKDSVT